MGQTQMSSQCLLLLLKQDAWGELETEHSSGVQHVLCTCKAPSSVPPVYKDLRAGTDLCLRLWRVNPGQSRQYWVRWAKYKAGPWTSS